jgi:hypothetical protein
LTLQLGAGVVKIPSIDGGFTLQVTAKSSNWKPPEDSIASNDTVSITSMPAPALTKERSAFAVPAAALATKRAGRHFELFESIVRTMLADIASGKITPEALAAEKGEVLQATYRGGREVCNKARAAVWVVQAMQADLENETLTYHALMEMTDHDLDGRYIHFLNQKKFGRDWDIFGKSRKIVCQDQPPSAGSGSRQKATIDK